MASGLEVAGLCLAVFPLCISAMEHYQDGFEKLQDWWRFRAEFVGFFHAIGNQSVLFAENLEQLLAPIVDSDVTMGKLLNDPGGPLWSDPMLEQRLRERLPKSYDWYRCTIDDMNDAIGKLKIKLGIENGQV